jgi:hypothetical protein
LRSLQYATKIRQQRRVLKEKLRSGEISIHELLQLPKPPPCLRRAQLAEMILQTPGLGKVKTIRVLHRARVEASATWELPEATRCRVSAEITRSYPNAA